MNKKWRRWLIFAVIAAFSAIGARGLSGVSFFEGLNLKAQDIHFVLRGQQPVSDVVLITLDQKALDNFKELRLFWHPHYANAIKAAGIGGAKSMGLDLAFGTSVERWEPGFDSMMAEAVTTAPMPVVTAYVTQFSGTQDTVPINILSAALGLSGFPNLHDDPDGFVRRQELLEAPSGKPDAPPPARSLAMRVTEKFLGAEAELKNGTWYLNGQPLPDRTITLDYAGGPGTFPSVSIVDVEEALKNNDTAKLRGWFENKAVMLGTDIIGDDRMPTPFYTLFSGPKWTTAGVEIHANTIRTLLRRSWLLPAPEWGRDLALALTVLVTTLVMVSFAARHTAWWMLAIAAVIMGGTHAAFRAGKMYPTAELLTAAVLCLIGATIFRFATAEKRGALFQRAVSLFVGKELATTLDKQENISLSGRQQTVTILFTDIRGFTAYSEEVCAKDGPQELVRQLNEYMAQMVAIIVAKHGHVNKFIGDGILAVFSDDDEGASPGDHALRAVDCATEMVTAPSAFKTGAGLHSGEVVVGNVGSADKMEFTVLGDTVNLASRLESLNKEQKTKLLMSGSTRDMAGDAVDAVRLGEVPVRGKVEPVPLYTVRSLRP